MIIINGSFSEFNQIKKIHQYNIGSYKTIIVSWTILNYNLVQKDQSTKMMIYAVNLFLLTRYPSINPLLHKFTASSTKDIWPKFQFWNKKRSSKNFLWAPSLWVARWTIRAYLRLYLENRLKIKFMKRRVKQKWKFTILFNPLVHSGIYKGHLT